MADKADKMKARLPRGFVDRHADDIRAVKKMTDEIVKVYDDLADTNAALTDARKQLRVANVLRQYLEVLL